MIRNIAHADNSVLNNSLFLLCIKAAIIVISHKPNIQRANEKEE
ncbi:MAG TPA: hypothetical protein VK668_01895 [Mucilaginibacter sp.]|nr:hypothetical protein [Mucilaginibacter sp.]